MTKKLERYISLDQLKEEAERFLRGTFPDVRGIGITGIAPNVRNPRKDMWTIWGARLIKVWGKAEVKEAGLSAADLKAFDTGVAEIGEATATVGQEIGTEFPQADGLGAVQSEVYESGYQVETNGEGPESSGDGLDSHRPVTFQLEVFLSKDGSRIAHRGALFDEDKTPMEMGTRSLSIEQLKERARRFLKTRYRSVRAVRIHSVKEATLHGAFVYDILGDAAASENEVVPPVVVFFNFRLYIRRDGNITLSRARMWQR